MEYKFNGMSDWALLRINREIVLNTLTEDEFDHEHDGVMPAAHTLILGKKIFGFYLDTGEFLSWMITSALGTQVCQKHIPA